MQKIKYFHSFGKKDIEYFEGELPELTELQILIETIYCGVCRNDIGQYTGEGFIMPPLRFGHKR